LKVLSHTTPAPRRFDISSARAAFSVHTPALSPYVVLFARCTASSGVRKVITLTTGPKISSRAIVCDGCTPVKIVGRHQKPFFGSGHETSCFCAPSALPALR